MKKVTSKKKNHRFYKFLSFVLFFLTVFSISVLIHFNVLPNKYLIVGSVIIGLIIFLLIYKLNTKNNLFTKLMCSLFSIVIVLIEIVLCIYSFNTIEFFNNIFDTGFKNETYGIYVLNDSNIKKVNDIKNIAIYKEDSESYDKALNKLKEKYSNDIKEYSNITNTVNSVINKENDALYINEEYLNIYKGNNKIDNLRLISKYNIIYKSKDELRKVNVTKKPFAIYISGIDTNGKVNKSARSDVNILVFVNPDTGKILLLNTPRDYYVTLNSKNAKDKLTHAGIYGTIESAKTLGLLYDAEINYYARVNFTSFVKIIDTIGGVKVDVEKPDYRYNQEIDCGSYVCEQNSKRKFENNTIYIKPGVNTLNGEQALAYARNRHQYSGGDNDRQIHQGQIIKAVIEKLMTPSILTKYNSILKSLSDGMITNIEQSTITKLVNYQIDKNIKWEIDNYTVKGIDGYDVCYSTGKSKAYVLIPNEESVLIAKEKISSILNGGNNEK